MNRRALTCSVMAALALVLISSAARADFFVGEYNGDNLIRRSVTVPNGQWVTVQTLDCGAGEDTVIFLLEGSLNGSETRFTRAFNDDFNGTFCSYIVLQNTTGASKTYSIVVTTYNPATPATIRLLIQRTPDPRTEETLSVGGVVHRWGGNGAPETIQTVPV